MDAWGRSCVVQSAWRSRAFCCWPRPISSFRLKHGEVRVMGDATLDRIALEQARAMAAKDNLSHEVLGSFTPRMQAAKRTYWAMVIAGDYEPKPDERKRGMEPLVVLKRESFPQASPKPATATSRCSAFSAK